jgi:hypothetical protein
MDIRSFTRPRVRRATHLLVGLSTSLSLVAVPSVQRQLLAAPLAKEKPVNYAAQAKKLAAQVSSAGSDAARYRALLSVMKALQLGVSTAKGKVVARGSGKAGRQLSQYDFELQGIAKRLGADMDLAFPQYVSAIKTEITDNGAPLDTDLAGSALQAWAKGGSQRPMSSTSLYALLVLELGKHHKVPYDLSQSGRADGITIDALQEALIVTAVARSAIAGKARARISRPARYRARSVAHQTCFRYGPCSFTIPNPIDQFLDWREGVNLSACFGSRPLFTPVITHYGPSGHDGGGDPAGKELQFQTQVQFFCRSQDAVVTSGRITGTHIPPAGPLSGVSIAWKDNPALGGEALTDYGTAAGNPSATNSDGVATMTFKPKDELVPGIGVIKTARGQSVAAFIASSAMPRLPPRVARALDDYRSSFTSPASAEVSWSVSRHAPRGFKFDHAVWEVDERSVDPVFGVSTAAVTETWSGSICGTDPYTELSKTDTFWQFHTHIHEVYTGNDGQVTVTDQDSDGPFPVVKGLNQVVAGEAWQFTPGTSGNPQFDFTFVIPDPTEPGTTLTSPKIQHVTVPVTEDTSCPAPTP